MGAVRTSHVFFLGLGGIGMSALARHLKLLGHEVGGYDLTPSPLLETLSKEGMAVTHSSEPLDLPTWAKDATPETLTVVWTPAVPEDLPLLMHFKARGIVPIKRAALLGQITDGRPTLAVAGTHGKTTTSSWLAAMLDASEDGCHAFLGGISSASGSNHITRSGAPWHVVEADEFDRSFHHLHPSIAAITNLETDHLDIYGTEEAFRAAFEQFGSQVQDTLLLPAGLEWPETNGPAIERFAVIDASEAPDAAVNHVARKEGDSVAFHLGVNGTSEQTPLIFSARPALLGSTMWPMPWWPRPWHGMPVCRVTSSSGWWHNLAVCAGEWKCIWTIPQPCTSTTTRIIRQSSKRCSTPSASVGPNVKSPLCFSLICTPERAILVQRLPKFWGKPTGCFCCRFTRLVRLRFQGLMHNGCLITSRAYTNN